MSRPPSLHRERKWALWGSYAALLVFVILFLVPPFYMIMTSLKSSAEISAQTGNPWLVRAPTLQNFAELITDRNFQHFFLNSVFVTALTVASSMVISVLAAFSLARMGFWGSGTLSTGVFLTYLIPASLLFIPLFQVIGKLGLINSTWCLVLIYPTLAVPFCTWIMIGYFSSIPRELDEAALIDGAGWLQMLWKIFIPVAMPGIIAATIFAFTVAWGAFLYPLAYLYTSEQMVLTVGIVSDLIRGDVFQWGKIMAGCVLAAAPPVIIYAFLMDYYIAGLTAGATKG
ncbi:MAG: ABC transporter permease subunit [Acetobacteraceae bacterium]